MDHMKTHWDKVPNWAKYTLYAILGIAGAFLLGLLFGNVIMWLWNWLMPKLFGLSTIGFWEGLGLFLLALPKLLRQSKDLEHTRPNLLPLACILVLVAVAHPGSCCMNQHAPRRR